MQDKLLNGIKEKIDFALSKCHADWKFTIDDGEYKKGSRMFCLEYTGPVNDPAYVYIGMNAIDSFETFCDCAQGFISMHNEFMECVTQWNR